MYFCANANGLMLQFVAALVINALCFENLSRLEYIVDTRTQPSRVPFSALLLRPIV